MGRMGHWNGRWGVSFPVTFSPFLSSARVLLAGAALLALLPHYAALAQEKPEGLRAALDDRNSPHLIGGVPLGIWLGKGDMGGCLEGERGEVEAALQGTRRAFQEELAEKGEVRAWQGVEAGLRRASSLRAQLVRDWISSPEVARRRWFCADGLPEEWSKEGPDAFAEAAGRRFSQEVMARRAGLTDGSRSTRARAILELGQWREVLQAGFVGRFGGGEEVRPAATFLEATLERVWENEVEPMDLGYLPLPGEVATYGLGVRGPRSRTPPSSMAIPDPPEVAAAQRIIASWKRQREQVEVEVGRLSRQLEALEGRLAESGEGMDLNRMATEAERLSTHLAQARMQLQWTEERVLRPVGTNAIVDGILHGRVRKRNLKKINKLAKKTEEIRHEADSLVEVLVARGAAPPRGNAVPGMGPRGGSGGRTGGAGEGEGGSGTGLGGSGGNSSGEAGSGAPLPPATPALPGSPGKPPPHPLPPGPLTRVYEGPLPTVDPAWSAELVGALLSRHPTLDAVDARLLLSLIDAAFTELGGAPGVEAAVWRELLRPQGMALRGTESGLSDLDGQAGPRAEVLFVITLQGGE